MFLPLIAFILLAGPANGSADNHLNGHINGHILRHINRHTDTSTKAVPTTRTTVPHNKSISTVHNSAAARTQPRPTAVPHKTSRQLIATKSLPATTTTTVRHTAPAQPTPTQPARVPLGTFIVTCYDLYGHTADGDVAGPESVAVDPSVIRLGTNIYVPGIGERTADDTGGLIIGNHIDIWEPSYGRCADWGVRHLTIYRVG